MKILRVDMERKSISYQDMPEEYRYFGGRGFIARLLNDEVDAKCNPLGADNKLIICPGLLTGTSAPCSGRISIGAKSPLTERLKKQMPEGFAPNRWQKLGLKAIIVEKAVDKGEWFILR